MPDWMKDWWPLVLLATPLVIAIVGWAIRKGLVSKEELATALQAQSEKVEKLETSMNDQLGQLDRRTIKIETEIRHLPTAEQVAELRVMMGKLVTSAEATSREVQSLTRAVNRVEDTLVKGASS